MLDNLFYINFFVKDYFKTNPEIPETTETNNHVLQLYFKKARNCFFKSTNSNDPEHELLYAIFLQKEISGEKDRTQAKFFVTGQPS